MEKPTELKNLLAANCSLYTHKFIISFSNLARKNTILNNIPRCFYLARPYISKPLNAFWGVFGGVGNFSPHAFYN